MRNQFQLISRALVCAIWLLTLSHSSNAQDASAALKNAYVTVNGQAQSNALAEILLREQLARGANDSAELRKAVREALINQALMAQEATAKLLLEKIQAGAKIADLSKEYSQDPQSRERGGLTEWVNAADLSPALAESVKAVVKGKLATKPVKSEAGWHVLQVEDVRAFKAPTFADTKQQLVSIVSRMALDARLKTLREQAKIQ